jgi:hypothetical protein
MFVQVDHVYTVEYVERTMIISAALVTLAGLVDTVNQVNFITISIIFILI